MPHQNTFMLVRNPTMINHPVSFMALPHRLPPIQPTTSRLEINSSENQDHPPSYNELQNSKV